MTDEQAFLDLMKRIGIEPIKVECGRYTIGWNTEFVAWRFNRNGTFAEWWELD